MNTCQGIFVLSVF